VTSTPAVRLPVPTAPRFPLIPLIAPLVVSAVLFLLIRSPYVAVFALLGPVMALATWWEAKRHYRHAQKEHEEAFRDEERRVEREQRRDDEAFRARQLERHPHPTRWLDNPLWKPQQGERGAIIRLGLGSAIGPSGRLLPGVPYLLDEPAGIALVGPRQQTDAIWRALVAQVLIHCPRRAIPAFDAVWPDDSDPNAVLTLPLAADRRVFVQRCNRDEDVDPVIDFVVRVTREGSGDLYRSGVLDYRALQLDQLTSHDARWVRQYLSERHPPVATPASEPPPSGRGNLVLQWAPGQWRDLVECGPHAVVWGQSGSGKTVMLRTMVDSISRRYTPQQVQVVWIDFKGGTGAIGLSSLPHVVGVLTDLQPYRVSRVYEGLAAEIGRRETLLSSYGVNDLGALDGDVVCPRTLIVIDEVAIVLRDFPQWNDLLADLAARGRALGLHLVVAGQRISGQVPRSVLANASLRMCLRIGDPSEAHDILSTAHSAHIDALVGAPPGTLLVSDGSQVATSRVESSVVGDIKEGRGVPLWCEPLPARIESGPATAIAIMDDPSRQSQPPLYLADIPSGMVVVTGDSGSGHSTLLRRWVGACGDTRAVMLSLDSVTFTAEILSLLRNPMNLPPLIGVDRLDRFCRGQSESYREWVVGLLSELGQAASDQHIDCHLVVTTSPHSPEAQALGRVSSSQMFLRSAQRPAQVPRESLIPHDAPPGAIHWNGRSGQVILAPLPTSDPVYAAPEEVSRDDDLVLSGVDGVPGAISMAEVDERFFDLERAYRLSQLVLVGVSGDALRALRIPPVPATSATQGWRLGPSGAELIQLEPLALGEDRIDADRVDSEGFADGDVGEGARVGAQALRQ
jgi:hypothetical protein